MAKPPVEHHHRFRIICETESQQLGPLLAQLTIMGLENIGYELITDVKAYGKQMRYETTAAELAAEWFKDHPTFMISELTEFFVAQGRANTTAHNLIRTMVAKGQLRQLDKGHYQSTEVKHLPAPKPKLLEAPVAVTVKAKDKAPGKKAAKVHTRPASPTPFDVPNRVLIVKAIKKRKRFTVKEMSQLMTDNGRSPKSASPIITFLLKEKLIKQIDVGTYEVLPAMRTASSDAGSHRPPGSKPLVRGSAAWLEQERLRARNYRANKKNQNPAEPAMPMDGVIPAEVTTEEASNG